MANDASHASFPSAPALPAAVSFIDMMLPDDQVEEFRHLYLAHGGRELTKEEATALASEVVAFVAWLYQLD